MRPTVEATTITQQVNVPACVGARVATTACTLFTIHANSGRDFVQGNAGSLGEDVLGLLK